ncbi:MAG: hypothetical protein ACE5J4_00705 [Candidatus Aenigmatarchaeota archaeon]
MKKIIFTFLIIFLFSIILVKAQDFTISLDVDKEYYAGRTGIITLNINNPGPEQWFEVSVVGVPLEWVSPEYPGLIKIPASGSGSMNIYVKPAKDATSATYQYTLKITKSNTNEYLEEDFLIYVKQVTDAIVKDFSLSCISCKDKLTVSGTVENIGTRDLDLNVKLTMFDKEKIIPIGILEPYDTEYFQETYSLKDMEPHNYTVEVKVLDVAGNNLYTDTKNFVIPQIVDIVYDKEVSTTPFGSFITITATNEGNKGGDAEIRSEVSKEWYSLYSGPTPAFIADNEYLWLTRIEPDETVTLSYSEIYWPTYIFIIFAVSIGLFIYWQFIALSISKNITTRNIRKGKQTSISLNIKNRRREMGRVIVRDIVPSDFTIVSKFATIKPIIRKVAAGTELVWRIGKIRAHEERMLHYEIKALRDIVGKVVLPSASVKAAHRGRLLTRKSNVIPLRGLGKTRTVSVKVK